MYYTSFKSLAEEIVATKFVSYHVEDDSSRGREFLALHDAVFCSFKGLSRLQK